MKQPSKSSIRDIVSTREAIALATLFSVAHSSAQTPAKKEEAADRKNTDGTVLDEITVSAERANSYKTENLSSEKFTAPLLNTPQTVTVIPQAVYKQQAATNLADVLKNTPGITYNAGENGFVSGASNFNMRGFESSNNVFVDGSRDHGNNARDIFNIEAVEVAKGPAADNGRGTAGGYVNLVTKTPGLENFYSGTTSYGFDETEADSRFRTTLDINQVVKDSPLQGTAFRLNALFQEGGVAGRNYAENNAWGIAPSVSIGLGTDTRFTVAYQYYEQNNIPDYGVPGVIAPGIHPTASGVPHLSPAGNVRRDTFYGRTSDFDDVSTHTLLARIEHDFASGATLTNQTRFSYADRFAIYTIPFGTSPAQPAVPTQVDTRLQGFDRQTQTFSNTTTFTHEFETGSLKHSIATGLDIAREESRAGRDITNLGGANYVDIYHPDPSRPRPLAGKPRSTNFDDVRVDTIAAYIYDTIEFNPQWQLTGGIRAEYYDAEIRSTTAADYDVDDFTLGGKLGLVYKPVDNGSIYASAGITQQAPGGEFLSNPDASRGGGSVPGDSGQNARKSKTQESINYELGTKWDFFDKKFSTTFAAFHSERSNIAFGSEPDLSYGDQTVYGLELGVAGSITENWSVFGGWAYMESNTQVGAGADAPMAFAPRWSGNLFTTYRFPSIGLTIGGGLQYMGESNIGRPSNTPNGSPGANANAGKLPDYIVFNALVAYEVTDNVTVRLNVDNLFDEDYTTTTNYPGTRAYLGTPRTYTISADWKF